MQFIENTLDKTNTCAVYLGMPVHKASLGSDNVDLRNEGFQRHCELLSSSRRKSVSDSQHGVKTQCSYYNNFMNKNYADVPYSSSSELLSSYMVDSALFIRDLSREECRAFNAELSCGWLQEIHCFSDRDQISFPYVLANMGVREHNDIQVDPIQKHRIFVDNQNKSMVLILKSGCHYYFKKSIESCYVFPNQLSLPSNNANNKFLPTDTDLVLSNIKTTPISYNKRVAVVISGTIKSFNFFSSLENLIMPLTNQSHHVDCFIALTTGFSKAFGRKELYMNHLEPDPILSKLFFEDGKINTDVGIEKMESIRHYVENYGGKLRRIMLQHNINIDDNELVESRRAKMKKYYPREDPDLKFPVKDLRSHQIKIRKGKVTC